MFLRSLTQPKISGLPWRTGHVFRPHLLGPDDHARFHMFGCLRAYLISLLSLDFFSSLCPLLMSVGQSLVLRVPSLSHSSDFWSLHTALIFNGDLFLISASLLQMFRFPSETQHSKTQTCFTLKLLCSPSSPFFVGGNPAILFHQVDLLFFSPS